MASLRGRSLARCLGRVEGKALYDGEKHDVYLRLAEHAEKIYLDLGNDAWEAVEISVAGWKVIDNPPVKFVVRWGMLALPHPVKGGRLSGLREFVNIDSDDDWACPLHRSWAALRPGGRTSSPSITVSKGPPSLRRPGSVVR